MLLACQFCRIIPEDHNKEVPKDISQIQDNRYDIEHITTFDQLAQLIDDNHLCLVINSGNFETENIL